MKTAEKFARNAYGYVTDPEASFKKRIRDLTDFFSKALQEQIERDLSLASEAWSNARTLDEDPAECFATVLRAIRAQKGE